MIGWIAAIIIGGIAGWLAEQFMKSQPKPNARRAPEKSRAESTAAHVGQRLVTARSPGAEVNRFTRSANPTIESHCMH
jgi:hypothetical protein